MFERKRDSQRIDPVHEDLDGYGVNNNQTYEKGVFATSLGGKHVERKSSIDEAYDFLQTVSDKEAAGVDLKRLRRRIDLHIVPIMFMLMGLQFLDKYVLSYAIIMGMAKDLKLKDQELNNVASALWWSYLPASCVIGLVLNKVPIAKWLGVCMTLWGGVVACSAGTKGYASMMVVRIFMGIFDAGIPPALMLISAQYYRKDEQATRYAYWFSSLGIMNIVGGLVSYGFQFVEHAALAGWRIMFLVLGLISLLAGIWAFIYLPDTPMTARFLTDVEKKAILQHVAINQTTIKSNKFEWSQVKDACCDFQLFLLVLANLLVAIGGGIINVYGATLVKSFGYSSKQAALLNTPSGAMAFVGSIGGALLVRHHILHRWAVSIIEYLIALLGACLIAFGPKDNHRLMLAGIWLIPFSLATVGIKYQWVSANVSGYTKRTVTFAAMSGALSIGNIIAPYAVQHKDAPEYQAARYVLVGTKAAVVVTISVLTLYYVWSNKRRNRIYGKPPPVDDETAAEDVDNWTNATDRDKAKTFRYVL